MKSRRSVVFLHGWGMNANIWQPFFEFAKNIDFDLIAIDLPGYGEHRNFVSESKSLASMTAFIDQRIEEDCIILGWSLGGLVAKMLAHTYPEKYQKVITVCSSPFFVEEDNWSGMKRDVLRMFSEQLLVDHEQLLKRFVALQTMGVSGAPSQNRLIMKHLSSHATPHNEVLKNGLAILEREDIRTQLTEVTVPHLAIFGKLDSLVPRKAINNIAQLNANMQVETFDKASHAPFISHPERFLETLQQFIEQS